MRFLLASLRKDLLLVARDPWGIAISAGIPVVLIALLVTFFGGERITPKGLLLVADEDKSFVSSLLTGAFNQGELANMITTEKVESADGHRRIEKGDASALLIIPKGLGTAFVERRPYQLTLIKNPSQSILPGIIEEVLSVDTDAAFYIQSLLGDRLSSFSTRPTDDVISRTSVQMRRLGESAAKYIDPPLITVETKIIQPQPERTVPMGVMMFPGMLMFILLFTSQSIASEVWKEHDQGVLRRIAAAPSSPGGWLAGKILSAFAMFTIVISCALAAGSFALNLHPVHPVATLLWAVFAGGMMFLLIASLQFYATNARSAGAFTNLLIMPLAMMGGSMMPLEFFPDSVARVGRLTPNGAAVEQMRALIEGRVNPTALAVTAAALLAMGAVTFGLSVLVLRRGFGMRD
jgi:ABC-type Na+ efflux pump permease subunit